MSNYEYIIATLPVFGKDAGSLDADALIASIRGLCPERDLPLVDGLLEGFDRERLGYGYYCRALKSRSGFIREYMLYDLQVRNTKTEYLNKALGRPELQDLVPFPAPGEEEPEASSPEFDDKPRVLSVLAQDDILARERGLDSLMWDKADELTALHIFDVDLVLAFLVKLKITDRWNKLDPETGRELFRRLVQEIRNTR